ncbi:Hypothetical protein KVN_LOCUS460 [uncultured virus]|nr:Hypothetical protein KVN_LOCUS460 [uncultured virus]
MENINLGLSDPSTEIPDNLMQSTNSLVNNLENTLKNAETLSANNSIGTETSTQQSAQQSAQQGGNFFWSSNNGTDINKKVLLAAAEKKYETVNFFVREHLMTDFGIQDDDGYTLLHYLVQAPQNQFTDQTINEILANPRIKTFINKQDKKNGDTPLIIAVRNNRHNLADKLIKAGADPTIKNKNNEQVATETEVDYAGQSEKRISPNMMSQRTSPIYMSEVKDPDEMKTAIQNIIDLFMRAPNTQQTFTETSQPTESRNLTDYDKFGDKSSQKKNIFLDQEGCQNNTEQYLQRLVNKYNIKNRETSQFGGEGNDKDDTESFLNNLVNKYINPSQNGGKIKKVNGQRRLVTYAGGNISDDDQNEETDFTETEYESEDDDLLSRYSNKIKRSIDYVSDDLEDDPSKKVTGKISKAIKKSIQRPLTKKKSNRKSGRKSRSNSGSRAEQLSRLINKQTNEINERVIKKIMEIMEVDEQTARDYKAALWKMVKDNNPEMKSPMDLSTELEKITTKKTLSKIDVEEGKKIREESRKKREEFLKSRRSDGKSRGSESSSKSSPMELSETSAAEIPSESNLSQTSFS